MVFYYYLFIYLVIYFRRRELPVLVFFTKFRFKGIGWFWLTQKIQRTAQFFPERNRKRTSNQFHRPLLCIRRFVPLRTMGTRFKNRLITGRGFVAYVIIPTLKQVGFFLFKLQVCDDTQNIKPCAPTHTHTHTPCTIHLLVMMPFHESRVCMNLTEVVQWMIQLMKG